jgi:hypothetical protein
MNRQQMTPERFEEIRTRIKELDRQRREQQEDQE